ncbi:hypothetical protein JOB18_006284 [Solea senegalensis]|uniref:Uncharacterized protein n=1 Tax=Solea senegalensis TaxID=28829 RepID=A0AAV6Q435_SOLSE|nr:hypothetical protein JOB18_006284 [Solea senegalensis]
MAKWHNVERHFRETWGHGMDTKILKTPSCVSTSRPDPNGRHQFDRTAVTNLLLWDSVMVTCGQRDLQSHWIKVKKLRRRGVLQKEPAEAAASMKPVLVRQTGVLSFEQQRELLELQLEVERTKLRVSDRNRTSVVASGFAADRELET